jgi:hypothetical protein
MYKLHMTRSQRMELLLVNLIQHVSTNPDLSWHGRQAQLSLDAIMSSSDLQGSNQRRHLPQNHDNENDETASYISRSSGSSDKQVEESSCFGVEELDRIRVVDDETQDQLSLLKIEIATLHNRLEDAMNSNQQLEEEKNALLRQLWSHRPHTK